MTVLVLKDWARRDVYRWRLRQQAGQGSIAALTNSLPLFGELVGHDVHAPDVVAIGGRSSLLAMDRCRMPARALATQR